MDFDYDIKYLKEDIDENKNRKKITLTYNNYRDDIFIRSILLLKNLPKLETLEIKVFDNNKPDTLPDILGDLTTLENLTINSNTIKTLPESIGNLTKLKKLFLHENILREIPNSIGNLSFLNELQIQRNFHLTKLPESICNLKELHTITCYNNKLTNLPEDIGNLINLKILRLEYNKLSELPFSIGHLTKLEQLYLNNNKLTNLPKTLGNLSNLKSISLNNNQLITLPDTLITLNHLDNLDLTGNQLTNLPGSIGTLANLMNLRLDNNKLKTLPNTLNGLRSLERLYLKDNQITELPETIGALTELFHLDITGNQLTNLPESIGNLSNLIHLRLNNNQFTTLPTTLSGLTSLQYLHLTNNKIKELPETLGMLTNLSTLYLKNNPLESIPKSIQELISIRDIHIDSNVFIPYNIVNKKNVNNVNIISDRNFYTIQFNQFQRYHRERIIDENDEEERQHRNDGIAFEIHQKLKYQDEYKKLLKEIVHPYKDLINIDFKNRVESLTRRSNAEEVFDLMMEIIELAREKNVLNENDYTKHRNELLTFKYRVVQVRMNLMSDKTKDDIDFIQAVLFYLYILLEFQHDNDEIRERIYNYNIEYIFTEFLKQYTQDVLNAYKDRKNNQEVVRQDINRYGINIAYISCPLGAVERIFKNLVQFMKTLKETYTTLDEDRKELIKNDPLVYPFIKFKANAADLIDEEKLEEILKKYTSDEEQKIDYDYFNSLYSLKRKQIEFYYGVFELMYNEYTDTFRDFEYKDNPYIVYYELTKQLDKLLKDNPNFNSEEKAEDPLTMYIGGKKRNRNKKTHKKHTRTTHKRLKKATHKRLKKATHKRLKKATHKGKQLHSVYKRNKKTHKKHKKTTLKRKQLNYVYKQNKNT